MGRSPHSKHQASATKTAHHGQDGELYRGRSGEGWGDGLAGGSEEKDNSSVC